MHINREKKLMMKCTIYVLLKLVVKNNIRKKLQTEKISKCLT